MATLPNPLPQLAADPSGRVLGLELPAGRLVDATVDGPWHEPLLWHADTPAVPGDWLRLASARRTVGLHPVLVATGGSSREGGPEMWDLNPDMMSYPGDHDAEELLAEFWEGNEEEPDEDYPGKETVVELFGEPEPFDVVIAPYGPEWPGLAEAAPLDADPDARAAEVADALVDGHSWLKEPRMALVPARRSADIPAAIGWTGPVNYENDVARLCAVLRSWEDRFGIRVVALTFDQLVLSVAAPPTTMGEAEAVAAEHFAFCPDNIRQGEHETLRAYAEKELLGQHIWAFWWD